MRGPLLRGMKKYAAGRLGLKPYLRDCGDGRQKGRKPARDLIWAMLAGHLVRETSFHSIEALVRSPARRNAGVGASFAEDTLSYFTERMDEEPTRQALIHLLRLAKRNKAFQDSAFIGLALDGTTVGRCHDSACGWCRPYRNAEKEVMGYRHHVTMISVVGTGLSLPFDVEPYGPKDSEYAAGQRLLRRSVAALGVRFADYVVVDAEYASSTFLHSCHEVGLPVLARLKGNLHELSAAVEKRFRPQPPHRVTTDGVRVSASKWRSTIISVC